MQTSFGNIYPFAMKEKCDEIILDVPDNDRQNKQQGYACCCIQNPMRKPGTVIDDNIQA